MIACSICAAYFIHQALGNAYHAIIIMIKECVSIALRTQRAFETAKLDEAGVGGQRSPNQASFPFRHNQGGWVGGQCTHARRSVVFRLTGCGGQRDNYLCRPKVEGFYPSACAGSSRRRS